MVHLDLPTIEIDLKESMGMAFKIRRQQKRGLAIIEFCAVSFAIRGGGNDQQAQGPSTSTALPVDLRNNLVTDGPEKKLKIL